MSQAPLSVFSTARCSLLYLTRRTSTTSHLIHPTQKTHSYLFFVRRYCGFCFAPHTVCQRVRRYWHWQQAQLAKGRRSCGFIAPYGSSWSRSQKINVPFYHISTDFDNLCLHWAFGSIKYMQFSGFTFRCCWCQIYDSELILSFLSGFALRVRW